MVRNMDFLIENLRHKEVKTLLQVIESSGYRVIVDFGTGGLILKGPEGERRNQLLEACKKRKKELLELLSGNKEEQKQPEVVDPKTEIEWLDFDILPHFGIYRDLPTLPWVRWRKKKSYRFLAHYFADPWNEREGYC